jgi:hypothetical protein
MVAVFCKGEMIKREIFYCPNAQHSIDVYLKDNQIIDPETQTRTFLENLLVANSTK